MDVNYNQIILITVGQNIQIPHGIDLRFLLFARATELFLSIPPHLKQRVLFELNEAQKHFRLKCAEDIARLASDVFFRFSRGDRLYFGQAEAPFGTDTVFLLASHACNAFHEIVSEAKNDALWKIYRTSNKSLPIVNRQRFALFTFNLFPTKMDLIIGGEERTRIPRSIRQEELLSERVLTSLYSIEKSNRRKAVNAFVERLSRQSLDRLSRHSLQDLQSLAVSVFQEHRLMDCNHHDTPPCALSSSHSSSSKDIEQVHFEVEDTPPSSSEVIQMFAHQNDMASEVSQNTAVEDAEDTICMSDELSELLEDSTPTPRTAASVIDRIPRKRSSQEGKEGKADRLLELCINSLPEIAHFFMEEKERLEASKTSSVSDEWKKRFCDKYDQVGEEDLKFWKEQATPNAVINVFMKQLLSSTFKTEEYNDSSERLLLRDKQVLQTIVDGYKKNGVVAGPKCFRGNWKPGDIVHFNELAFSPKDGGISTSSHMNRLYNRNDGEYCEAVKKHLGMIDAPSVAMQSFDELLVEFPATFHKQWKEIRNGISQDHLLHVLVKRVVQVSQLIRKDLVLAIDSAMKKHGVKPVLIVNRVSGDTKKTITNYSSLLKKLFPELSYTELPHPTFLEKAKIIYQSSWNEVTDGTHDVIFYYCGEPYFFSEKEGPLSKQEVRVLFAKKGGMKYIFEQGYQLRYEPYAEDEKGEIQQNIEDSMFVNGTRCGLPKGYTFSEETKEKTKRKMEEKGTRRGLPKGYTFSEETKEETRRKMEEKGTKRGPKKGFTQSEEVKEETRRKMEERGTKRGRKSRK